MVVRACAHARMRVFRDEGFSMHTEWHSYDMLIRMTETVVALSVFFFIRTALARMCMILVSRSVSKIIVGRSY